MEPTKVGVIGAGMAGPALALFLKAKGYSPIVYERNNTPSEAGLGIGVQQGGHQVLAKIPGLLEHLHGWPRDEWHFYSVVEEDEGLLGTSDSEGKVRERKGLGTICMRRPILQQRLVEFAEKAGVPFKWGHKLESLQQDDERVTVSFANGARETFSFVVGCDGLHSNTRGCLFGEHPATYVGLCMWGGVSPAPDYLRGKSVALDVYGNGASMIVIPMDETTVMWATTQSEPESKETWRTVDETVAEEFKKSSPYSKWGFGVGELVRDSTSITKYGLYDRPELKTWHSSRVVLVGDAAHPTTPHLGQGANQAFQDIDTLIALLDKYNPSTLSPTTSTLGVIFQELAEVRIPRTAELVKQARALGETRVVEGVEACIKRNNFYREMLKDEDFHNRRFGE